MRIKRYILFASLWLILLTIGVTSKQKPLEFVIYCDQEMKHSAEVKNEVLMRYALMMRGVHEESEIELIRHNLDDFMWDDNMIAKWENHMLKITIGDGKGVMIHGDLKMDETCLPQVKTKSLFAEWFGS